MKSFSDRVQSVKGSITEVTVHDVKARIDAGDDFVLIDIREPSEVAAGQIKNAHPMARGIVDRDVAGFYPDPNTDIVLYCAGGSRSALSARDLQEMGYTKVASMDGGFNGWKNAGLPWVAERQLTNEQKIRYSRHFLLPEVGEKGQNKLLNSKVLCVGAGGLGSPAALYLAAAGVGTIGIIDDDVVDISNLQRQILHNNDRVGMAKVDSAELTLTGLNPDVKVIKHQTRLSSENIIDIIKQYDVVVDGCDNFPTRYLINDACVFENIPNVHGSIFRFDGQVTLFHPGEGPCYRCLYPEPPPPGMAPSCAEAGVLGVLPGIIGSLQAVEAIKILLGVGKSLAGRMIAYDALEVEFREFTLKKDAQCPVCSENPTVTELIDYEQFCSAPSPAGV